LALERESLSYWSAKGCKLTLNNKLPAPLSDPSTQELSDKEVIFKPVSFTLAGSVGILQGLEPTEDGR